jgi:cobalamin biosynthesis Mg chelatase CobN
VDTAVNVAIPEFDGRIIAVPVSFKERGNHGAESLLEQGATIIPAVLNEPLAIDAPISL